MSVLVKGIEIPKTCYDCRFRKRNGLELICPVLEKSYKIADPQVAFARDKDCPLVAIPEHGDLIDRDAFIKELEYSIELEQRALDGMECAGKDRELLLLDRICRQNSIHYLSEASIIIPASKESKT